MATKVLLHDSPAQVHRGTNSAKFDGTNSGWVPRKADTTQGSSGSTGSTTNTVAGATNGVECVTSGSPLEWITAPVDADVTISGAITANLYANESNMSANVAINFAVDRMSAVDGSLTQIVKSARTTELPVGTNSVQNFTATPGAGVALNKGDRLRIRIFGDDSTANMGSGFTFFFAYDNVAAADGDSYLSFTETFGFQTTDPTGTVIYPTNNSTTVATADVDFEAWTARGDSAVSVTRDPGAGWAAPQQLQSGGTNASWFTKQLQAFTLGGLVKVNLRAQESALAGNSSIGVEIARVDSDGTNATIWGYSNKDATANGGFGELTTSEAAYPVYVSGDDLSVSQGQRLRIRLFVDDAADLATASNTVSAFFDGPTGGASGDTFLTFEQTLAEFAAGTAPPPPRRRRYEAARDLDPYSVTGWL